MELDPTTAAEFEAIEYGVREADAQSLLLEFIWSLTNECRTSPNVSIESAVQYALAEWDL